MKALRILLVVPLLALLSGRTARGESENPRTEVTFTFGYENGKTDEPLVVQNGVPSTGYTYRADSESRSLSVSATRWTAPIPDDGVTPFAILPDVARSSRITVFARLGATSRDSRGTSGAFESRFSSDRTLPSAGLSAEWYFLPSMAVTASVDTRTARETGSGVSMDLVSQRQDVLSIRNRSTYSGSSLGVVRWLGSEVVVTFGGYLDLAHLERTDESSSLPPPYRRTVLDLSGTTWGVRASGRAFLSGRRLVLDASGSYSTTSSQLDQEVPGPVLRIDEGYSVGRSVAGRSTWYPTRSLGLFLGLLYATRNDSGGIVARRPTGYAKQVRVTGGASVFASARRAAVLTVSRTTGHSLNPPGGPTYQQLRDVVDVVELTALLRF